MVQTSKQVIKTTESYGAKNFPPLPIVISEAINQGHHHPRNMEALEEQAGRVTFTSRTFHNDLLDPGYEKYLIDKIKMQGFRSCTLWMFYLFDSSGEPLHSIKPRS